MKVALTLRPSRETTAPEPLNVELPADARDVDDAAARLAMSVVLDPCSRFNGSYLSVTELGMIRGVTVDDESIAVELFLDDPSCVYMGQISHELRQALEELPGEREIRFSVVADDFWTTDRLSTRARERMESLRSQMGA